MCRLLGLAGKSPLPIKEALNGFYPLCKDGRVPCNDEPGHLDGWGIAGFSGGRAVYFERQAASALDGKTLWDAALGRAERCGTPIVMAHLRKASSGAREISNTHPFQYRDWIFAHNGTVFNAAELPLQEAQPQGKTDSERCMLWMLERVIPDLDPTAKLVELIREARRLLRFSALTFLISDGKKLWAYVEVSDKKLEKNETLTDREHSYGLYQTSVGTTAIVCSEPMSSVAPSWRLMEAKTLVVFSVDGTKPESIPV